MNNGEENINIDLITRYLSGETSPDEEKMLNAWLDSDKDNRRLFDEYSSVWENMEKVKSIAGIDLDREWELIESRMDDSATVNDSATDDDSVSVDGSVSADDSVSVDGSVSADDSVSVDGSVSADGSESAGDSVKVIDMANRKDQMSDAKDPLSGSQDQSLAEGKAGKRRSGIFIIGRIAAAAAIIISLALGGLYTSRNVGYRILATTELPQNVILPDGSTVTLNTQSILRYPKKFKKDQRGVSLEGEGFFEVNGDPEWPFVITTTELDIRVLGTSFNVNAYQSNSEVEVVVKTGQVAVTRHGDVPKTIILKPGSKAVYRKAENELKLSTSIDKNYLAWKTKSFVFTDESLENVAAALNKVYDSEIVIPSDSLKKAMITSSFNDQTLDAILNVLSATLDIEVVENKGQILLKESN